MLLPGAGAGAVPEERRLRKGSDMEKRSLGILYLGHPDYLDENAYAIKRAADESISPRRTKTQGAKPPRSSPVISAAR